MSTLLLEEQRVEPRVPDVPLHEAHFRRDPAHVARREVVEDDDAMAQGEEGVGEVGTDEPGTAGDEDRAAVCRLRNVALAWLSARIAV